MLHTHTYTLHIYIVKSTFLIDFTYKCTYIITSGNLFLKIIIHTSKASILYLYKLARCEILNIVFNRILSPVVLTYCIEKQIKANLIKSLYSFLLIGLDFVYVCVCGSILTIQNLVDAPSVGRR